MYSLYRQKKALYRDEKKGRHPERDDGLYDLGASP